METVIQVIFKNEGDAFAAKSALLRANNNFDIELEESYVIRKNADGTADVRSEDGESAGEGVFGGAALGGLVGLLGGPVGVALGVVGGMMVGSVGDLATEDDIEYYLDKFAKKLSPDETMLVAHIWEYNTYATDEILKPYGGTVTRLDVDVELYKEEESEIEAIDKEIAASDAAWAAAKAEDKAAWEAKTQEWKQKREDAKQKFNDNLEKRKEGYKTWASGKKTKFEEWKAGINEKLDTAKKERLQKRIDKQTEELQELHEKYAAI